MDKKINILKWLSLIFLGLMIITVTIYNFTHNTIVIHIGYGVGILFILSFGAYIILKKE